MNPTAMRSLAPLTRPVNSEVVNAAAAAVSRSLRVLFMVPCWYHHWKDGRKGGAATEEIAPSRSRFGARDYLCECLLHVGETLLHLGHAVGALGHGIFEFDIRGELVLLFLDQLQ